MGFMEGSDGNLRMNVSIKEPSDNPCIAPATFKPIEIISYILFGIGPLVGNAMLSLLGPISIDFLVDPTVIMIAIPSFMIPFALFQLFSGALSDSYGRVPIIAAGLIGFLAGLTLISSASTVEMFALGHIVAGIGFGFVNPVLLALLSDCAVPEDIPKRMGIASALSGLGVGLGPFIAGQIALLGWQLYYLAILVIVFIGLIAIVVAKRPRSKVLVDSGIHVLINNLGIELKKPVVLLMVASGFLVSLTYLGTLTWTSRGFSGAENEIIIGILLLVAGISGAVSGTLLGRFIRYRGYGFSNVVGIIPLLFGLILFLLIGDITLSSSILVVGVALALVGWGGGILFPLMITYSQVISPERRGVLAGIVTSAFFFGAAINPSLYEPLFLLGMSSLYLGILSVSVLLAIFLSILYRRIDSPER